MAPIYDIPSTVPYGDSTFALPLAGRRENLTAKAFRTFGSEIGLPQGVVDGVLTEVAQLVSGLPEQLLEGVAPWDEGPRRDIARVLRRRRRDLTS